MARTLVGAGLLAVLLLPSALGSLTADPRLPDDEVALEFSRTTTFVDVGDSSEGQEVFPARFDHGYLRSDLDGEAIEVGVYRPETADAPVPVILVASPYFGNLDSAMDHPLGYFRLLVDSFVPQGYAVAGVAVRGTGDSGGCFDLMGLREVGDLDQAVTWLGTRDWSNGRVAMTGVSYDGSTPWSVASTGNPHLVTIVPMAGVPDPYEALYRNGTAGDRPFLTPLYYASGFVPLSPLEALVFHDLKASRNAAHIAKSAVCPESAKGTAAERYSSLTGARDPLGFWSERNHKPGVAARYQGSILSVQGLQDWNVDPHGVIPWVDALGSQGLRTKQVLGQWGHSLPDYDGFHATITDWFAHHLKNETHVDLGAPVEVQDTAGGWRTEAHFPPRDARWARYHLAEGRLVETPAGSGSKLLLPNPAESPAASKYEWAYDIADAALGAAGAPVHPKPKPPTPSALGAPGAAADFDLGAFDRELRISGLPRAHLTVTAGGPGGHLCAFLYLTDANGTETALIGATQMDLRYADGGETPRRVKAGDTLLARMELEPLDAVVPAGSGLRLRVGMASEHERLPSVPTGPVTLHYGPGVASTLELPLVERGGSPSLEPPKRD